MDINKYLAEKLMGWKRIPVEFGYDDDDHDFYGDISEKVWKMYVINWNPKENIEQAYQCEGKILENHELASKYIIALNYEAGGNDLWQGYGFSAMGWGDMVNMVHGHTRTTM